MSQATPAALTVALKGEMILAATQKAGVKG